MSFLIKPIVLIILITLLLNTALFFNAHCSPSVFCKHATSDQPFYFEKVPRYWSEISEFAICNDILYVLFDQKGVLACFDIHGNYLYSFAFEMSKNGKSHLYVKDELLYFESRNHIFYLFDSGKFVGTNRIDREKYYTWKDSLVPSADTHIFVSSGQYELQGASIWKIVNGDPELIVHRPEWLIIFQGNTQMYIYACCLLALALQELWSKCIRLKLL